MWIPNNLDEFIGNSINISKIKDWFENFDKNKTKCLLLIGPTGCGKTLLAQLLLQYYKYNKNEFNGCDLKTKKNVNHTLYKILFHKNILEMFLDNKAGIIIDELENMLSSNDKSGINELIQILKKDNIYNPIIITLMNNVNDKKINEIKKYSFVIDFTSLEFNDLSKIIDRVSDIKILKKKKLELIESSKDDIRRLIFLIEDYNFNKKNILNEKDGDFFIEDAVTNILTSKLSIQKCLNYNDYDSFLLPLYLFENYPNAVKQSTINKKDKVNIIHHILDSIIHYDIFYSSIFNQNHWCNLDVLGIYSVYIPNFYLSKLKITQYNQKILYASLYNKLSLKYSNKKIMNEIYSNHLIKKNDLSVIIKFIQYYIHTEDEDYLKNIFENYNINKENIEILFKIYKYFIKDKKFTIKYKNKIIKLI